MENNNGWGEWSKYVLKELERLGDNSDSINKTLANLPCSANAISMQNIDDKVERIINNDLKHINQILSRLYFGVMGGVLLVILVFGVKFLFKVLTS